MIGVAFDDWMLYPGWKLDPITPGLYEHISMEDVANHIDHICQIAGNVQHVGLGTDLDGGYGTEETPGDLDTIADVQKLPAILRRRGYSEVDIEGVMYRNWVKLFRLAWS